MPRQSRKHLPGAFYHITQRGNAKKTLFFDEEDRLYFCSLMKKYFQENNHIVHAFCLMDNHIHILVQVGNMPVGNTMQCLTSVYAKYLNKKLKTSGHQFQGRYYASIVDSDDYLLQVLKYIHLNPVKAQTVNSASEYRWSTHNHYCYKDTLPWVNRNYCHNLFSNNTKIAVQGYINFMEADLTEQKIKRIEKKRLGSSMGDNISTISSKEEFGKACNIHDIDISTIIRISCKDFKHPEQSIRLGWNDKSSAYISGIISYIVQSYTEHSLTSPNKIINRSQPAIRKSKKNISDRIYYNLKLSRAIERAIDGETKITIH